MGGVRLGGGMVYNEVLLYWFGVFGVDGGFGFGVEKVIKNLIRGLFVNLFRFLFDVGMVRKGMCFLIC